MRARAILALGLLWWAAVTAVAAGDGGRLRAREESGPFVVALFTKPEPLSAGIAELSVLVADRRSGVVLLDAEVTLALAGPDGASVAEAASRQAAGNRLFYAARVVLPKAGEWRLLVRVRRNGDEAELRCALPVEAAPGRATSALPLLVVPPVAVALFAANLVLRRRTKRERGRLSASAPPFAPVLRRTDPAPRPKGVADTDHR